MCRSSMKYKTREQADEAVGNELSRGGYTQKRLAPLSGFVGPNRSIDGSKPFGLFSLHFSATSNT